MYKININKKIIDPIEETSLEKLKLHERNEFTTMDTKKSRNPIKTF